MEIKKKTDERTNKLGYKKNNTLGNDRTTDLEMKKLQNRKWKNNRLENGRTTYLGNERTTDLEIIEQQTWI